MFAGFPNQSPLLNMMLWQQQVFQIKSPQKIPIQFYKTDINTQIFKVANMLLKTSFGSAS